MLTLLDGAGEAQAISFRQAYHDALAYAVWLQELGLKAGNVVLLAFDHEYDLVRAFLGAGYAGLIPCVYPYVTNYLTTAVYGKGFGIACARLDVRAVLTSAGHSVELAARAAPLGVAVHAWQPQSAAAVAPPPAWQSVLPETAYLQLSSGTSGMPKAITVPHAAMTHYLEDARLAFTVQEDDVNVLWVPFFHDMGMTSLLQAAMQGVRVVSMAPELFIRQPRLFLQALSDYGATLAWMPNFGFSHLLRRVDPSHLHDLDLRALRLWVNGAEPILPETVASINLLFAPCGLRDGVTIAGYGLAECMTMVSLGRVGAGIRVDHIATAAFQNDRQAVPVAVEETAAALHLVGCGQPLRSLDVAILDDDGLPLAERAVGEIAVRGPTLFAGYWRQPELTAAAFRNGWLLTGDLGYLAEGELFVCGRVKDLIIMGGANLNPEAIEQSAMLAAADQVRRAAAFGMLDPLWGSEVPVLVIETRMELPDPELAALLNGIRRNVAANLGIQLGDVRNVPAGWIAMTTSGKVMRAAARQKYSAAGYRPETSALTMLAAAGNDGVKLENTVTMLVCNLLGATELPAHANLFEYGLDSLGFLRLVEAIEQGTGRHVPVDRVAGDLTVANLCLHLFAQDNAANAQSIADATSAVAPPWPRIRGIRRQIRHQIDRFGQLGPIWGHQPPPFSATMDPDSRALPYGIGIRLLRGWMAQRWVQERFFTTVLDPVRRWQQLVGSMEDALALGTRYLIANHWVAWSNKALSRPDDFAAWVTVNCDENVRTALTQGKQGVILMPPHTHQNRLVGHLPWIHGREMVYISQGRPLTRDEVRDVNHPRRMATRAIELDHARALLRRNGIVFVAGDGTAGLGGIEVDICGRIVPFQRGAAELAVATGAVLAPVFTDVDTAGRITIDIPGALVPTRGPRDEQVESLTRAYAALYTERWPRQYATMQSQQLRMMLGMAPV